MATPPPNLQLWPKSIPCPYEKSTVRRRATFINPFPLPHRFRTAPNKIIMATTMVMTIATITRMITVKIMTTAMITRTIIITVRCEGRSR